MPRLSLSGGQTLALGSSTVQAVYLGSDLRHFNPKSIANLGLWLDASADSSLTLNANTVSEWRDLSGNGRHMEQGTAVAQPIANTRTQNARRALDFQGGQFMLGNAASLNVLRDKPGVTAFIVGKIDQIITQQTFMNTTRSGSDNQTRFTLDNDAPANSWRVGGRRLDSDTFNAVTLTGSADTNSNVLTGVLDYANSDAVLYENGSLLGSNTSFQTDGNTADTDSDYVHIGANIQGTAAFLYGFIGEVILYQRALSDAERQGVERYLGHKWGITVA